MSVEIVTLFVGAVTAALSAFVTAFTRRRRSPGSESTLLTASTLLLSQLQERVSALEQRLEHVESENRFYEQIIAEYVKRHGNLDTP